MKIIERIVNLEDNSVQDIERNLTKDEIAINKEFEIKNEEFVAAQEKAKNTKSILLEKLGITAEEAKLLLS